MEYPGTRFTRPWRRLLLFLVILAFCGITPPVVLSATGFVYDWHLGIFKSTGALSIDALPSNATAELNGTKITGRLPLRLNHLAPGTYTVNLSAPGFYTWKKTFDIKSKKTTYLKDIQLIALAKSDFITAGSLAGLSLSPSGRYLAYASSTAASQAAWLLDTQTGENKMALEKIDPAVPLSFAWSPKGDYLAVTLDSLPKNKIAIIPAFAPERRFDLANFIANPIIKTMWADTSDPELYIGLPQQLLLFSVLNKESRAMEPNQYLDWFVDKGRLATLNFVSSTKDIAITKDALGFASALQTLPNGEGDMAASSSWRFQMVSGDTVLMQNYIEHRRLLADGKKINSLPEGNFKLSPFNTWLFIWSPWELWGFAGSGDPFLLNRSGEKLNTLAILDEFNTLALVWNNRVSAFFPVYGASATIINHRVTALTADANQRLIYFTDEKGLWKLAY